MIMYNNIYDRKNVFLMCDDNSEVAVFTRFNWDVHENGNDVNYELTINDSYCGGDYKGISGRFKRAWHAFWAKPIYYTAVFCEDGERMKKFLEDCLELME